MLLRLASLADAFLTAGDLFTTTAKTLRNCAVNRRHHLAGLLLPHLLVMVDSSNNPFPDNGLPSVAIAAYWDNLHIRGNAGYEITYRVYDDADYRAVSIDWCVVDEDDVVTHFMVILRAYDLSNPESVFMRYFQSNGGKSATIAVQNLVDAKSEQFSYDMEDAVPDGCTVLFFTIGGDERVVYVPP
ncbi:hypothetical protein ACKRZS_004549 [Fusarium odoratissimum]